MPNPRMPLPALIICLVITLAGAQVGGPCTYQSYQGIATITRIAPVSPPSSVFDAQFTWAPTDSIAFPSGYSHVFTREFSLYGALGMVSLDGWHVKPGHAYACTLDIIKTGTCSPLIFNPVQPAGAAGYDTSSPFMYPDTARAGTPFTINVLGYEFSCSDTFSDTMVWVDSSGISLSYRKAQNPLVRCAQSAYLRGISFTVSALAAGKYPVRVYDRSGCCLTCDSLCLSELKCVDTLVVKSGSAVIHGMKGTSARPMSVGRYRTSLETGNGLLIRDDMNDRHYGVSGRYIDKRN